jgi:hypothetical protein
MSNQLICSSQVRYDAERRDKFAWSFRLMLIINRSYMHNWMLATANSCDDITEKYVKMHFLHVPAHPGSLDCVPTLCKGHLQSPVLQTSPLQAPSLSVFTRRMLDSSATVSQWRWKGICSNLMCVLSLLEGPQISHQNIFIEGHRKLLTWWQYMPSK